MTVSAKNQGILNFSSFSKKSWFPGQKQGFSYKTKYPRINSGQKTYFQKNGDKGKKLRTFKFQPNQWKIVVTRAKIGFWL